MNEVFLMSSPEEVGVVVGGRKDSGRKVQSRERRAGLGEGRKNGVSTFAAGTTDGQSSTCLRTPVLPLLVHVFSADAHKTLRSFVPENV